ncbi:RHS repeat-associated core domain-containing protein [Pseudomonas asiatica]|uniref:RHS repeat-associated core domain-containing protein n=1 Tax=Pseudomonas asiatica TaxID=2219225 RepID=UPI00383BCBD7
MSDVPLSLLSLGKTTLLQVDDVGSIVAERGSRQGEWSFLPYGQLSSQQDVGALRFVGQWFDPVVQGYFLGNGLRLYIPAIMRFLSPDSLSPFAAGGINGYVYCSGDPVNFHDPSGRSRTGLTKLLKDLKLPKRPLRDYLKPLGRPENFEQKRIVFRATKDADFEQFVFKGAAKITGGKIDANYSGINSFLDTEHFYRFGELYIPQRTVPPDAVKVLERAGFELIRFDLDGYLSTFYTGASSNESEGEDNPHPPRNSNLYVADPVAARAGIRRS